MTMPATELLSRPTGFSFGSRPNRTAALDQYRSRAGIYDLELFFARPIRQRAVATLSLKRRDVVIDVGCGTGLSFGLIQERIGAEGQIIAIEQSPEMVALAAERAAANGWTNITFLQSPVEDARIPIKADAALFHFTHDILQTQAAVDNVMRQVKPGGRVVSAGLKWASRWLPAVNAFVRLAALRSTTTANGLDQPWRALDRHLEGLVIEPVAGGGLYISSGVRK
jgi:SAM-dependent methyltransferase